MRSGVGVTASMMQNGGGAGQIKLIFTLYEIFVSFRICIKNGMCGILVIKVWGFLFYLIQCRYDNESGEETED